MRGSSDIPFEGECWFCTETCYGVAYCSGCDCFICNACNEISSEDLERKHDPSDHQTELAVF